MHFARCYGEASLSNNNQITLSCGGASQSCQNFYATFVVMKVGFALSFVAFMQAVAVVCCGLSILDRMPLEFEYYGENQDFAMSPGNSLHFQHSQDESKYTKTGTTIVGMCCKDGVVLGADTRSTGDNLVMNKNTQKVHYVSPNIRCCAAGTSADCKQITRKADHHLGLLRIEHELAGEDPESFQDSVSSAVTFISSTIRTSRSNPDNRRRKVSSVQILGGVDVNGPALYQIDQEGVPMRISYGSLGSGSINALAVLESERRKYRLRNHNTKAISVNTEVSGISGSVRDNEGVSRKDNMVNNAILEGHCENITVSEAIDIVRKAVRSGILNDMGSGSHVDLCVITNSVSKDNCTGDSGGRSKSSNSSDTSSKGGVSVKQWREKMESTWNADRISSSITNTDTTATSTRENSATNTTTTTNTADLTATLGKRIFSRIRPIRRIMNDKVQECDEVSAIDDFVGFNIEFIE